jgi:hypothetical protein
VAQAARLDALYTNAAYGFSIRYPKTWQKDDTGLREGLLTLAVIFLSPPSQTSPGPAPAQPLAGAANQRPFACNSEIHGVFLRVSLQR